jgi:acyl-CoA synthetase (AMP-forming)/AMP-acid ligase II
MQGMDLSSWDLAFCGAEPIRPAVLDAFARKFEKVGFNPRAFYPCYGLAEATLMVTGGEKSSLPVVREFSATDIETRGVAKEVSTPGENARSYVGCGDGPRGHTVAVVDPVNRKQCPEGVVGEIWFSGPSVAQGYFNRPDETRATFQAEILGGPPGHFMRTGDLGFLKDGEIFITGRIKDLLIIRGRNVYPQDIERTIEATHPALKPGAGAVFSVDPEGEKLVAVFEVDQKRFRSDLTDEAMKTFLDSVRSRVFENHELQIQAVSLIRSNTIPMTSSGKIQRQATRKLFLDGRLEEMARLE